MVTVDIEEIRAPAGVLAADKPTGDQFVSIDGRKTYFNLFPTQAHDGVTSSPPPLVRPTAAPSRFPQVCPVKPALDKTVRMACRL